MAWAKLRNREKKEFWKIFQLTGFPTLRQRFSSRELFLSQLKDLPTCPRKLLLSGRDSAAATMEITLAETGETATMGETGAGTTGMDTTLEQALPTSL